MINSDKSLYTGAKIPCIGIGTFGSDKYTANEIANAVYGAIKAGYRLVDCASVYQNEKEIGISLKKLLDEGEIKREQLFITSKVWNDMHDNVIKSCEKSLEDLNLDYLDLYFVHWPFPNYHAPGCDGDSRNPNSKPFSIEHFIDTWRQCEALVESGKIKHIGMSNMTTKKLSEILPLCKIKPAALEMELHPSFQQKNLFDYAVKNGIVPIGYCPIGSPSRPDRDKSETDVADAELASIKSAAEKRGMHPALICLKWAVQRGQVPIPFSVKEEQYSANLNCIKNHPLTDEEMAAIEKEDKNCRLIKGQVFLWEGAESWKDLWDGEE